MPIVRTPAEVLGTLSDQIRKSIRKCLPATVTGVDYAAQTVDVQVAVNSLLHDDVGSSFSEPAPGIPGVPLGVLRGGGFLVSVPVAVGDSVLLVWSDYSTDTWLAGDGTPQDPGFHGVHSADSPFAIPMFAPDAKKLSSPAAGKIVIGKDGSDEQVVISGSDIKLGASASKFVALAELIDLFIQTVMGWTPVPNDGGAALKSALALQGFTTSTTTAATLVKAK